MNIGEVARESGVSTKMIRYYERIGLIPAPGRNAAGYRTYGPPAVETLRFVHRARDLGFPLVAIRQLLTLWQDGERSSREVKRLALETADGLRGKLVELERMISALHHLADHCQGDDRPDCPIIDQLAEPGAAPPARRPGKAPAVTTPQRP